MATKRKVKGDGRTTKGAAPQVLVGLVQGAPQGATLDLPPGRYELSEPLHLDRQLTLRGAEVTLVAPKGKHAIVVETAPPVVIEGLSVEGSLVSAIVARSSNLTLRDCTLQGPGYTKKRDGMHGVHSRGGELRVEGGSFEGFDSGVCVDEAGSAVLSGIHASNNDTGVLVTGGAGAVVRGVSATDNRMGILFHEAGRGELRECEATGNREIGIGAQLGTVDVTVAHCRVRGGKNYGMHFAGPGTARVLCNRVEDGPIHAGLEIEVEIVGNVVTNSSGMGIILTSQARGTVRHNFVTGGKNNGIDVWDKASPTVRDNICVNNAFAGISAKSRSPTTVAFNFARNNGENGVWIHGESKANVSYNDLSENVTNGILAFGDSAPTLRANHCELNDSDGVLVSGNASPLVEDNTLAGNTLNGFEAADQSAPVVRRNRAYQNACDGFRLEGETRAVLEENIASENLEDGVSIHGKAAPQLRDNRFERNDDAAIRVVGKKAKPTFKNNVLSGNGEDKVVRA